MRAYSNWLTLPILLLVMGCSKQKTSPNVPNTFRIQGAWALHETRHSTGTGIQMKPIGGIGPLQSLRFGSDGRLYRIGDDLKSYFDVPFYQVDSTQAGVQLQLLDQNKELIYSAGLSIQRDHITITPPCKDSCYFKLNRIIPYD